MAKFDSYSDVGWKQGQTSIQALRVEHQRGRELEEYRTQPVAEASNSI
jgi:hypothetical protein